MDTYSQPVLKRSASGEMNESGPRSAKRPRFSPKDHDSTYASVDSPVLSAPTSPHACDLPGNSTVAESLGTPASSKRPKSFFCGFEGCNKAFDRPARLQTHIRSHTNERPFTCSEIGCGKSFLRSEHLKAHIKSKHNDNRDYVCTYSISTDGNGVPLECGKSFHTGTRLRRHIAAHEDKEQTKCQECGKIFRRQETLQRHIRADHLNEKAFRCQHVDVTVPDDQSEECGNMFATVGQLKAHQSRDHGGSRYFCDVCVPPQDTLDAASQVGFATYAELQVHLKTVHPPTCIICSQACDSNRALKAHMEIEHSSLSDRQRFECSHPGCDRKFTKTGNLKVHIQTVHAKVKKFTCGQHDLSGSKKVEGWSGIGCGMSFGTKGSLEDHIKTQHLGLPGSQRPCRKIRRELAKQRGTNNGFGDEVTPVGKATSSLTGYAYEQQRPLVCLEPDCDQRFLREYDLVTHLELYHEWNIDDINDYLADGEDFEGEKFWIGGDPEVDQQDELLKQRLVESLDLDGRQSIHDQDMALDSNESNVQQHGGDVALDPLLAGL